MTDEQDPLPELTFTWRRWYTYAATLALLLLLGWIVWGLTNAAAAKELGDTAFWLIMLIGWLATCYLIAPSGEQVVKMVQAAKIAIGKKE